MKLRSIALIFIWLIAACSPQSTPQPQTRLQNAPPSISKNEADAFLDDLQLKTFKYFWDLADPETALIPDRWPTKSFASIAASGYALTAYPIGVERGYITREESVIRVLQTLRFFWNATQSADPSNITGYQGFFYHFLDVNTGYRFENVELSTIDTTLMIAGALLCQTYFDRNNPEEAEIRKLADDLYRSMNWPYMVKRKPAVSMGWTPEGGFIPADWQGFNEAMILVVLAIGSPTHPIDPSAWKKYTDTNQWGDFYGEKHVGFAPLFGHHYSHVWIDFREIQDPYIREKGIDYFENTRRATYGQRAYAIDNPMKWKDYSAEIWGLSACDGPLDATLEIDGLDRRFFTYAARGADFTEIRDDGTITPAAAGGSLPFTPEIALPALMKMRNRYRNDLFSEYGFLDAFNPTLTVNRKVQHGRIIPGKGWFDSDYLGIDQGVLFAMIENYRSEFVWRMMRKNPYIVHGLKKAGFTGGWLQE